MTGIFIAASGRGADQLTVACVPSTVSGVYETELGAGVTHPSTAVPTGGVSPFSYSWTKVSGYDFTPIGDTTSSVIVFSFSQPGAKSATYRVTVVDAIGQVATADLLVNAS